jgi:hypothetical protein
MPNDVSASRPQPETATVTLAGATKKLKRMAEADASLRKIDRELEGEIAPYREAVAEAQAALDEALKPIKEAQERAVARAAPFFRGLARNAEAFRLFAIEYPELLPKPEDEQKTVKLAGGYTYLDTTAGIPKVVVKDEDEDAAVKEVQNLGWDDLLETKVTLNRKEISKEENRPRVEKLTRTALFYSRRFDIGFPESPYFMRGKMDPKQAVHWNRERRKN